MAAQPSITPPWYAQRTFWTSLAGVVTAGGGFLAVVYGEQKWAVGAAALAALLANLGSVFARQGGVEAAQVAVEAANVAQVTADEAKVEAVTAKAVAVQETESLQAFVERHTKEG